MLKLRETTGAWRGNAPLALLNPLLTLYISPSVKHLQEPGSRLRFWYLKLN